MVNAIRLPTSTPAAPLLHKRNIHVRKRRVSLAKFGYSGAMLLDSDACFRAVRARDRRFDGRFFTAVATTGIYCRPICPVRAPKRENMRFFRARRRRRARGYSGHACVAAPNERQALRRWMRAGRLIGAAIAGIEEHALSNARVGDLAASLGRQRSASAPRHRSRTWRLADRIGADAAAAARETPARSRPRSS